MSMPSCSWRTCWRHRGASSSRIRTALSNRGEELAFRRAVGRRAAREPAAYILGQWGFRRLTLAVDPRVLVPRPETEVGRRALPRLRLTGTRAPLVLDVGTGSGAIALAIADERAGATRSCDGHLGRRARARGREPGRGGLRGSGGARPRPSDRAGFAGRSTSSSRTRRTSLPRSFGPRSGDAALRALRGRRRGRGRPRRSPVARGEILAAGRLAAPRIKRVPRAGRRGRAPRARLRGGGRPSGSHRAGSAWSRHVSSLERAGGRGIRAGKAVVLPTDTVYGLVADGYREAPARRSTR